MAMIDPPREEVFKAVEEAKSSGIKTIMITGDHKTTAAAIAREIGIMEKDDLALTGKELDSLMILNLIVNWKEFQFMLGFLQKIKLESSKHGRKKAK